MATKVIFTVKLMEQPRKGHLPGEGYSVLPYALPHEAHQHRRNHCAEHLALEGLVGLYCGPVKAFMVTFRLLQNRLSVTRESLSFTYFI